MADIGERTVQAVHGRRTVEADPPFERGLADAMRARYEPRELVELYGRFAHGESDFDFMMRRAVCRAMARSFGDGVRIGRNVEVRPVGGAAGCMTMILFSIIASVVLTVLLNLLV